MDTHIAMDMAIAMDTHTVIHMDTRTWMEDTTIVMT